MKRSKYDIDPREIYKMNVQELKAYIRGASKTMSTRVRRISNNEFADFSELLNELEEIESQHGKLTGATRNLTEEQLKSKAVSFSRLFRISETSAQLNREGFDNIKNFFKTPRFTRQFIEGIHRNQTMLKKLANKNDKFIRDILGSEQIRAIVEEFEDDPQEMYRKLLSATSDTLDLYDEDAKQELIDEEWDAVFTYEGDSQWRDDEGNIVDTYSDWKWKT